MTPRPYRSVTGLALMLAVGVGLAGCAWLGSGGASWDPFAPAAERNLLVRVENPTTLDVRIEALAGGRRVDLGMVSRRTHGHFRIPWSRVESIRFRIEPLGGRSHTTTGVSVGPGEQVELIVQNPVDRSVARR